MLSPALTARWIDTVEKAANVAPAVGPVADPADPLAWVISQRLEQEY